jgi:hypothetical protein
VFDAAGFDVEYTSGIFFVLPLPIFLLRSIPSRLGLRKQKAWDRYQEEHKPQAGLAGRLIDRLLALELAFIRGGRSIAVGGSCLVVGRKKH